MNTIKNSTTIHLWLDKCIGSCNTLIDSSSKICVLNKTEDLNIYIFNMITGKNE